VEKSGKIRLQQPLDQLRKEMNMKRYQAILALVAILVLMSFVGSFDAEEEARQQEEYCSMVKLWKESKGQAGWPAYNGEGACK
jgi:hypothetical protein